MGSEPANWPPLVERYARVLSENDSFCRSNPDALEASIQLQSLTDDARRYTAWEEMVNPEQFRKRVTSSAMDTYICFIFRPLAFAAYFDFLAGNVVTVFMQLRTLLEQLAKCYQADMLPDAAKESFFATRVQIVEGRYRSKTEVIRTLEPGTEELWRRLSNDWIHMTGMNKLVNTVIQGGVPSFTNVVPIAYGQEDISIIREIGEDVKRFIDLVRERFNSGVRYTGRVLKWDIIIEQKTNDLGGSLSGRRPTVDFVEPTPTLERQDDRELRAKIIALSASQAHQLGIGKSTLHYLRRNAKKDQFRIYKRVITRLKACKGGKEIG
jgi:hypothetical protein